MSKSYGNTIEMFAPEKTLRRQVMGIVTDSAAVGEPKDPERSHLYALYCLFAAEADREAMAARFREGGLGYAEVKKEILARVLEHFGPARERRAELARRPDAVEDILREGAARARETAREVLEAARRASGLGA
jgi:tryptophanyl-tRNA synthetase